LQCTPYHGDSALYPVIQYLNRVAGFTPADPPDVRVDKLSALLAARGITRSTALPILAELLSIPLVCTPPPPSPPAQRKAAMLALLVEIMMRIDDDDPVLVVLEDAHWIDATTLEMMTRLTDSIGRTRLFAVVSARSDFVAPWHARPHATQLTL